MIAIAIIVIMIVSMIIVATIIKIMMMIMMIHISIIDNISFEYLVLDFNVYGLEDCSIYLVKTITYICIL